MPAEVQLVLSQLGLDQGELLTKKNLAPLGDPLSLLIGSHTFTLRAEICRQILVESA
jgi:Fe2+ transport system protein FeoA